MKYKNLVKRIGCKILFLLLAFMLGWLFGMIMNSFYEKDHMIETLSTAAEESKQIAITFDDGPNPDYTMKLLKGLKKRGVKATFFVLGEEVERYPDILKATYDDGHMIGVHSYQHVNFGQIGDAAALEQVEKTQQAIYDVTGEYTGYIRPPYGCWKKELDQELPMIEVLWDIDPLDWATKDADTVVQRVLQKIPNGSIILLHDASESSVSAAFTIIDTLQKQGYEFVTVEELMIE